MQAATEHSLPLKRVEAGLRSLVLWGSLKTRNGRDYLIAEGYSRAMVCADEVLDDARYYFSQDGTRCGLISHATAMPTCPHNEREQGA